VILRRISRLLLKLEGNPYRSAAFHFRAGPGRTRPERFVLESEESCRGEVLVEPSAATQLWLTNSVFSARAAAHAEMSDHQLSKLCGSRAKAARSARTSSPGAAWIKGRPSAVDDLDGPLRLRCRLRRPSPSTVRQRQLPVGANGT